MMAPGYVPMPPPGMPSQPVYAPSPYNQGPPQQYAQAPLQQRPVVRAAPPRDEKPPVRQETPVSLPGPDKLGIAPQAPADPNALDWNAIHAYTKSIGVLESGSERLPEGGYRFHVVMPTAEAGRSLRIDGSGATENDAVRVCLDKTYRWLKQIP
jgi:hypothetical protein